MDSAYLPPYGSPPPYSHDPYRTHDLSEIMHQLDYAKNRIAHLERILHRYRETQQCVQRLFEDTERCNPY
jgi:hypothetical protein